MKKPRRQKLNLQRGNETQTRAWVFLSLVVILMMSLSGCDALLGLPFQQEAKPNATVTAAVENQNTNEAVETTQDATATSEPENHDELVIWIPPWMNPDAGTPEGELLKQRLASFNELHPEVTVTVRIKARSGQAGLMDSLISTSTAAPLALPSLIILPRRDLEQAAKRGLILPMGDYSTVINELDWFQFSRMMSSIGDSTFGLPFSGNAMVMVYRTDAFVDPLPKNWAGLNELGEPVYFAAANPAATFPMALYLSLGGSFVDGNGKPTIDVDILSQMLSVFAEGNQTGVFPANLYEYQDPALIWNEYLNGRTNIVVTWANYYLSDMPENSTLIPMIPLTDYNYTLADGWLVALADPLPERRALSVELAEYLVDVSFNSNWNFEAGYLPMRSGSLNMWENQTLKDTVELISYSARPYPTQEITDVIAPVLVDALSQVLTQGVSAVSAAQNAVAKLESFEE